MGLMDWFKSKNVEREYDKRYNHVLTDEERDFANQVRRNKMELAQKEKELRLKTLELEQQLKQKEIEYKLAELDDALNGVNDEEINETDSSMDKMLMAMLIPMFQKMNNPQTVTAQSITPPTVNSSNPPVTTAELSDDELYAYWDKVPFITKKIIRKLDDTQLIQQLKTQFPNYTDDTYNRALRIIRER